MTVLSEARGSAVVTREECRSPGPQYGLPSVNPDELFHGSDGREERLPSGLLRGSIRKKKKLIVNPASLEELDEAVASIGERHRSGDEDTISIASYSIAGSTGNSVRSKNHSHLIANMHALDNVSSHASSGPAGSFTSRSVRSSRSKRSGSTSSRSRRARYTLEQVIQATIIGASVHDTNQSEQSSHSAPHVTADYILHDLVQTSYTLQNEFAETMRASPQAGALDKFHLRPRFNPLLPSIASGTQGSEDGSESLQRDAHVPNNSSYLSSQPWDEPFPANTDTKDSLDIALEMGTTNTSLETSTDTRSYQHQYESRTRFVPVPASESNDRFSQEDIRQTVSDPESYPGDWFESDGWTSFPSDGWTSFDANNPFIGSDVMDFQKSPSGVTDFSHTRNWKTSGTGRSTASHSRFLV